ncbi:MAG: hypothetical protein J5J06_14495 [Phycisphaerae bacterium]|nr:hypothetical protein [Phycisphaerae bacterium]
MSTFTVNRHPGPTELRRFGWAMLGGFGAIGLILWVVPGVRIEGWGALAWAGRSGQLVALALWSLGIVLCVLGNAAPGVAKPIYVVWMSAAVGIGIVMSTVLLTLMFFALLPIFALIVRRSDPMRRRLEPGRASYWESYPSREPTLERMRRPF